MVDAIRCLTGQRRVGRNRPQIIAEARTWVASRDPRWPFSFDNLCSELGFDAERLRTRLLSMAVAEPVVAAVDAADRREERSRPRAEDIIAMIRAGEPLRVVGERFGISVPQVSTLSSRLASRLKLERDDEIRRLHDDGLTYAQIAGRFGLSHIRVRRICRAASQSRRRSARPGGEPNTRVSREAYALADTAVEL